MDGRIFSSATASEYLSPIPSIEMFLGAAVEDVDNPREITLTEFSRMRRTNNGIRWESGRSWETTEGAVAKAYAAEFDRRLDYFASLSGRIRVQSRHRPHLSRPGVTFEAPFVGDDEHADAQVSRRLLRLLEGAVLATGKKPNPGGPLVIDRAYWAGVVDAYFGSVVGEPSDEGLILEPAFLPVLAEWARIFGLAEGETIRMIRAESSLPSAPEAFVAVLSGNSRPDGTDGDGGLAVLPARCRGREPAARSFPTTSWRGHYRCDVHGTSQDAPIFRPRGGHPHPPSGGGI
jgi:hypothetical protein